MKSFDQLREELDKIPLIEAPITAKQWEKVIVAGYNYIQHNDKGNDAVAYDLFKNVKKECKTYIDGISQYASGGDKLWYCGEEMGKMSRNWTGTNATFKTDMYLSRNRGNSKVKISLKAPGAQIVSSEKNETLALLNAVNDIYMKNNPDPKLKILVKEVGEGFGSILTKFTTTELKKLAKNPTKIIDVVMEYLELNKMHSILEEKVRSYYNSSLEFRKWFVYEAMSGHVKFAGGLGEANHLLMGNANGFISMQKLVPTLAAKYANGLTIGVRFISHKRGRISTSLRGDLKNGNVYDHIACFMLSEMNFLRESKIELNENIITTLLGRIIPYITEKLLQVLSYGISNLLRFLNFTVSEVSVIGGVY
jgi:hypothetical protein